MPTEVQPSEQEKMRRWLDDAFLHPIDTYPAHFPVSFRYGGALSSDILAGWTAARGSTESTKGVTFTTLTYTDPHSGLECRCEVKAYTDYPAVEWVARFVNVGDTATPILADIQPLDILLPADPATPCQVHHARGGLTQRDDFEPLTTPITFRQGGSPLRLAAHTGKSSTLHLPFFNLEMGQGGIIGAVGWSGGWAASFERRPEGVSVRAGMERTHLRLQPGEEIRTPRILLLFWDDDRVRAHNLWRRLLLAHYTPQVAGQPVQPPFCDGVWGGRTQASHLDKLAWLRDHQIPTQCYWIDAGWYGDRPVEESADIATNTWAREVGSWRAKTDAYPNGLRPIGDAARAAGLGFLVWVEPERAYQDTDIVREHPDWLLGPQRADALDAHIFMVNLGIPEARRYVTNLVSALIDQAGITCYRQDFNFLRVPALFAASDAPDRVGMTEIRHIEGLYAFWDELRARHPGLIIDNCAGGGQRIDLETIPRSVPLWRSDLQCWPFDPIAMQTQTQGLAPWIPLSAAVCEEATAYAMRSALGPGLVTHWSGQALEAGAEFDTEEIRRLMGEAHAMRKYFYGDFYPLLSFSLAADAWAAWQYDRPDLGEGMLVAFRRHAAPFDHAVLCLHGLNADDEYELCSWDNRGAWRASGEQLMKVGLDIAIDDQPGSALFTYRRLD